MVMPNMAIFGSCPIVVPLRMVQIIQASVCPASGGQTCYGVVEELDTVTLPRNLKIGLAYVVVDKKGQIPFSIANFRDKIIYLRPKTLLVSLQVTFNAVEENIQAETGHDCRT